MGTAVTALPPAGSALFDRMNVVEIELLHTGMELEGRDQQALAAGANLALIGEELVQFGGVEPLAPRRFRLSQLLRGRRGTEWAAGAHQVGESFALIEPASLRAIELPPGLGVGTPVRLLASGVGDAQPAAAELVARAEKLRPPAPVHLRATDLGGGDVELSWVRRSRFGWSWASGGATPLGEESELFEIELAGAGGSRRLELGECRFRYEAAARAADGPGAIQVSVVQLGTHGRSRPANIIID
jgi:hypothetical protein